SPNSRWAETFEARGNFLAIGSAVAWAAERGGDRVVASRPLVRWERWKHEWSIAGACTQLHQNRLRLLRERYDGLLSHVHTLGRDAPTLALHCRDRTPSTRHRAVPQAARKRGAQASAVLRQPFVPCNPQWLSAK